MQPFPKSPDILKMAERVVWFEDPEQAIKNQKQLLAHALQYGTHDDIAILMRYVDLDDIRQFLEDPPPGILDERSWTYWHILTGNDNPPPLPERFYEMD